MITSLVFYLGVVRLKQDDLHQKVHEKPGDDKYQDVDTYPCCKSEIVGFVDDFIQKEDIQ